jgi:hypothetical protein
LVVVGRSRQRWWSNDRRRRSRRSSEEEGETGIQKEGTEKGDQDQGKEGVAGCLRDDDNDDDNDPARVVRVFFPFETPQALIYT